MIEIIGFKRLAAILIFLSLNTAAGASVYFYFLPKNESLSKELRSVRASIVQKTQETEGLRTSYQEIQKQKTFFDNLKNSGFFSDQDRIVARQKIESIQAFTNVLEASYSIQPAQIDMNPIAKEAGHIVIDSPVNIKVKALDDYDLYNFIYWMENAFPGFVVLNNLKIERKMDIDAVSLRQIGSGKTEALIEADIEFGWRSMLPESEAGDLAVTEQ